MSAELIAATTAVIVSVGGTLFNYYKLKDEQKTWEQEHRISIEKKLLFRRIKKRHQTYSTIFSLLGYIRDIEYPPEHHQEVSNNKDELQKVADEILKELYGEAGLFMEYSTRSFILRTYQTSYKFIKDEVSLDELIDSFYYSRRAIRKDLEFDDVKGSTNKDDIVEVTSSKSIHKSISAKEEEKIWSIENYIAHSSRPGYPNKIVSLATLNKTIQIWKNAGIKSILCLLSTEEMENYYKIIQGDLIKFYKSKGFIVHHISVTDFQTPPLSNKELLQIDDIYTELEKPFIVHCGAGEDRTGQAISYLKDKYNLS